MNEQTDLIKYIVWPQPHVGGRHVEPQEKDPEIYTMSNVNMKAGESCEFRVWYETFKGPATVILRDAQQNVCSKSGRSRNGTLEFNITKATTEHSGVYTVEVLDEQRPNVESLNPVYTQFRVNVEDSGRWRRCTIV